MVEQDLNKVRANILANKAVRGSRHHTKANMGTRSRLHTNDFLHGVDADIQDYVDKKAEDHLLGEMMHKDLIPPTVGQQRAWYAEQVEQEEKLYFADVISEATGQMPEEIMEALDQLGPGDIDPSLEEDLTSK